MLTKINGLPAHVLLVHVVIAVVPLAALLVVLHAVWPAARRRLGIVTPLVALVALVIVPITASAGRWFKNYQINTNGFSGVLKDRIIKHANLGATLLWFVIALFVVAAGLWLLGRWYEYGVLPDRDPKAEQGPSDSGGGSVATAARTQPRTGRRTALPTWASAVVAVVALAVAVATSVQLYRIGESGAHAVWDGTFSH